MENYGAILDHLSTNDLLIMLVLGLCVVGIIIFLNNDDQHWW